MAVRVLLILRLLAMVFSLVGMVRIEANEERTPSPQEEESDYRLGPGDVIRINVFNYPEMTTETRIRQTGRITFPLLGEVDLDGLTVAAAEARIADRLRRGGYIAEPHVTLGVLQFRSREVTVLGEVNHPGKYALERPGRILDLLALAGGLITAEAADTVTLLRRDGSKVTIDVAALLEGDVRQNLAIQGGDTLLVPKAPKFYVYGEVQRPGAYRLERGMSVTRAISLAGGLTPRGAETWPAPILKRRDAYGQEHAEAVEGSRLLQADDVLYVRERWF
jgi:polysaccharide export outer membrane protein